MHVVFVFADHFEPHHYLESISAWLQGYPGAVRGLTDDYGNFPRHTIFYHDWKFRDGNYGAFSSNLLRLGNLCWQGLAEIELHLHHATNPVSPFFFCANGDDHPLRSHLRVLLPLFTRAAALAHFGEPPAVRFGFIHGGYALDNSQEDSMSCGCNDELTVLHELGCYADFTMPAHTKETPRLRNQLYFAIDDPTRPKSYDVGPRAVAGSQRREGLLMFLGPGHRGTTHPWFRVNPMLRWLWDAVVVPSNVDHRDPVSARRISKWLDARICVEGRPEWIFVKLFTHGAKEETCRYFFEENGLRDMYACLLTEVRRRDWRLHFASAREAYNIVMAAVDGHEGNPEDFRNYLIGPPLNQRVVSSEFIEPIAYFADLLHLRFSGEQSCPRLNVKDDILFQVEGEGLREVRIHRPSAAQRLITMTTDHAAFRLEANANGAPSEHKSLRVHTTDLKQEGVAVVVNSGVTVRRIT